MYDDYGKIYIFKFKINKLVVKHCEKLDKFQCISLYKFYAVKLENRVSICSYIKVRLIWMDDQSNCRYINDKI